MGYSLNSRIRWLLSVSQHIMYYIIICIILPCRCDTHVIVTGCAFDLLYDIVHHMHHMLVITPLLGVGFLTSYLHAT